MAYTAHTLSLNRKRQYAHKIKGTLSVLVGTSCSDLIKVPEKLENHSYRVKENRTHTHVAHSQPDEMLCWILRYICQNKNKSNMWSSSLYKAPISNRLLFFNRVLILLTVWHLLCEAETSWRRWPTAGPITLTGSGFVGYLHHSPPGKAGAFILPFTLHAAASPLATAYTCMIMKCHILHSNCILDFKRAKKKNLCEIVREGEKCVRESLSEQRRKKSESVVWTLGGNKGLWRVNASESETPAALQRHNQTPFLFSSHPPTLHAANFIKWD